MSSAGQIVGGIAGAAIGFFVPGLGPILGAQIGMMVGGAIDPPKGPSITGPRLEDLSVQTATYGAPLPRGYGTVCVSGNIFWLEGDQLKEWTTTEESGGKGGGGSETTTYHYSATFAVGLMHVPAGATVSLRRLWIDTDLVYEAGSDNTESIIASNSGGGFLAGSQIWQDVGTWWLNALATGQNWTFYDGADDQLPNARMQADKGAANVSAYPGLSYIVFEDLSLEKYSNTLLRAQVKAELVVGVPSAVTNDADNMLLIGPAVYGSNPVWPASVMLQPAGASYALIEYDYLNNYPKKTHFCATAFSDFSRVDASVDTTPAGGEDNAYFGIDLCQVDELASIAIELIYGTDNTRLIIATPSGGAQLSQLFDRSQLYSFQSPPNVSITGWIGAYKSGVFYLFNRETARPGVLAGLGGVVSPQAETYKVSGVGFSDNYIYIVEHATAGTTTTVYKLGLDLQLLDTYTDTADPYNAAIYVESDDVFYTASRGNAYKWVAGQIVETLTGAVESTFSNDNLWIAGYFAPFNTAPLYCVSWSNYQRSAAMPFVIASHAVAAATAPLREIVEAECSLAGIAAADLDLAALTNSDVRGFRVAQRGAVRNSLEPLQAAYPFDVAQSGYQIKFVSRGGASVASIPEADLAATDGTPGVLLPVSREMDSQLPFRVSIRYTDPDREYDIGEQAVERYEKDSLNERVVELPLSLTSGEAIQMADILLAKEWTERSEFGPFALPPTWRHLEPADVVTVTHRGQDHTLRLTRVEYLPDGRLVCNAKLTAAASYASSATAQSPLVVGQSLVPLKGTTTAYLLDMPRIRSEQDVPGLAFGLLGMASGWPGGTLLRSDDSGGTWTAAGSSNAALKVFTAGAALAAHHGYSIDHAAVLTVTPALAAHTLASVTEDQLYAHANLAAYGADGRWEIVAFKTVTDNTGSYTLKDFLRGLYGSEWASGLHAEGDTLVLLDAARIGFCGLPTGAIGAARLYRAVTQGSAIDSASDISDTYEGHNLKPLAPVDVGGYRDYETLDWTITLSRRSRWPVELFSGVSVPLGETSEAYEVEIWDSGYTTLKRTLTASSASVAYSSAWQVADFGSNQTTLYLRAYQMSSVIGRGLAAQGSVTRNVLLDPYIDNVVLLMHMDDTGLTDQRSHAVTANGSLARSATQSKFGGYSAGVFGSGNWLELADSDDWTLGSGDFTIELFFYITAAPGAPNNASTLIAQTGTNINAGSFHFGLWGTSLSTMYFDCYLNSTALFTSSFNLTANTWHHAALVRNGATLSVKLDGETKGSVNVGSNNIGNFAYPLMIGRTNDSYNTNWLNGYVDEVRFTKACRYPNSTYTVPTAAFPNP